VAAAADALRAAGAALLTHPARGLLYARFPEGEADPGRVGEIFRLARSAAHAAGGHANLEHAPVWAREGRDVFDVPAEQLPLHRELKRQYDPGGVLNPCRFAGGL
jgi:FAD/FMN-containing dehydrogenase